MTPKGTTLEIRGPFWLLDLQVRARPALPMHASDVWCVPLGRPGHRLPGSRGYADRQRRIPPNEVGHKPFDNCDGANDKDVLVRVRRNDSPGRPGHVRLHGACAPRTATCNVLEAERARPPDPRRHGD